MFLKVKKEIESINPNIEVLYKYDDSPNKRYWMCRCKIDGYEWRGSYYDLRRGTGCAKCAGRQSLTMDKVKIMLKDINKNIEIISDNYVNNHTKFLCKCLVDSTEWMISWSNLRKGRGCPTCGSKRTGLSKRISEEDAINRYKNFNTNVDISGLFYTNGKSFFNCECKICGKKWTNSWGNLSLGQGCWECHLANKFGENHPNWNPNLTDEQREELRDVGENVKWRNNIFENADYTCEICNVKGNRLNAHHKDGYHWCKERRFDVSNGVCLCNDCHKTFHSIYGNKHNTEQQWIEFYESQKIAE